MSYPLNPRGRSFLGDLIEYNGHLAALLPMSVILYRLIIATGRLLSVVAGIFAIQQGTDPAFVMAVIGVVLAGPDVWEAFAVNGQAKQYYEDDD